MNSRFVLFALALLGVSTRAFADARDLFDDLSRQRDIMAQSGRSDEKYCLDAATYLDVMRAPMPKTAEGMVRQMEQQKSLGEAYEYQTIQALEAVNGLSVDHVENVPRPNAPSWVHDVFLVLSDGGSCQVFLNNGVVSSFHWDKLRLAASGRCISHDLRSWDLIPIAPNCEPPSGRSR